MEKPKRCIAKTEIDYILTNRPDIVADVTVMLGYLSVFIRSNSAQANTGYLSVVGQIQLLLFVYIISETCLQVIKVK